MKLKLIFLNALLFLFVVIPFCLYFFIGNLHHHHYTSSIRKDLITSLQLENSFTELQNYITDRNKEIASNFDPKWLTEHIPEEGGKPIRNLILSTWRSGSSFISEVLTSHPGTIFFYEPFMHLKSKEVENDERALNVIKQLFDCNFKIPEFLNRTGVNFMNALLRRNTGLEKVCEKLRNNSTNEEQVISNICKQFPIQLFKFVRLNVKSAEELLMDDKYDTRILYLVRDPRGTMNSRRESSWWCNHPHCSNSSHLCNNLVRDYFASKELQRKFPDTFLVQRFEDIVLNLIPSFKSIIAFFGLKFHPKIERFLQEHNSAPKDKNEFSLFRKSEEVPFKWIQYYKNNTKDLNTIQEENCKEAMDLWGYKAINNFEEGKVINSQMLLKDFFLKKDYK